MTMFSSLKDNPRARLTVYQLGKIASAVLVLLAGWKVIDVGSAAALGSAITALLGLFGFGASGVAASAVTKQLHERTLDFTGSAADQAVAAIEAVNAQATSAVTDLDKVRGALGDLAGTLPVVGPLAQQVIDRAIR